MSSLHPDSVYLYAVSLSFASHPALLYEYVYVYMHVYVWVHVCVLVWGEVLVYLCVCVCMDGCMSQEQFESSHVTIKQL